ncbi:glycosyltransferase [Nonomuraea recticatena]|uniref:glycosyltransferase n=1 Tax=Nonomuraea recticatena TaxID=46178 RepID=UPI003616045A
MPARNEELRIAPCLSVALADPAVAEVIVVDDESTDATARVAAGLGAKVVKGEPLPLAGWASNGRCGRAWPRRAAR